MSSDRCVYLDYNATTPLEPDVLTSISEALRDSWGNPSSSHEAGVSAKKVIDHSRACVAEAVGAAPNDIVFTSGGTEANNWVIYSVVKNARLHARIDEKSPANQQQIPHIITTNLEHDSVKLVLENLEKEQTAVVTYVPVSKRTGCVDVEDVLAAVQPNTCLVTVMMANNETGIIQPVREICERLKQLNIREKRGQHYRIFLHTDAAQTVGKIRVDVSDLGVDYLTIVGHKFYGPRIGALYVRGLGRDTPLHPLFYGGGQEKNLRPGTENTGMIAGLGKAAELVTKNLEKYQSHMSTLRDHLEETLTQTFGDKVHFNGKLKGSERIPNTCNFSLVGQGLEGGRVLGRCYHLQASVGAACHSGTGSKASPILLAIGVPRDIAKNAVRLSVGRETTREDIDLVIKDLQKAVESLQKKPKKA